MADVDKAPSWLDESTDTDGMLTRQGVITGSKFVTKLLATKAGQAVIDAKTGQQSFINVWEVRYIQEGRDKEQAEEYSFGKTLVPSADGETLVNPTGGPVKLNKDSGMAKARNGLKAAGYPIETLHPKISAFIGSKIVFMGEPKKDLEGKAKTHTYQGKTYTDYVFYPAKFLGRVGGVVAGASSGNGATLATKTEAAILAVLAGSGGKIDRAGLVTALAKQLSGDAEANQVIALTVRSDFHTGRPWAFDGGTLSQLTA